MTTGRINQVRYAGRAAARRPPFRSTPAARASERAAHRRCAEARRRRADRDGRNGTRRSTPVRARGGAGTRRRRRADEPARARARDVSNSAAAGVRWRRESEASCRVGAHRYVRAIVALRREVGRRPPGGALRRGRETRGVPWSIGDAVPGDEGGSPSVACEPKSGA